MANLYEYCKKVSLTVKSVKFYGKKQTVNCLMLSALTIYSKKETQIFRFFYNILFLEVIKPF